VCSNENVEVPLSSPHTFLRIEDFSGKTFYDRFNQKYEIQEYDSKTVDKIKMKVNGDDYLIEKDVNTDTYSFKTPTGPELESFTYTLEKGKYWVWSNNKNPLNLSWSEEKYNPYKISNFPAVTYAYVTRSKSDVPALTDFVTSLVVLGTGNDTSAVEATKTKFLKLTAVKEYLTNMLAEYAKTKSPIDLTSSQKEVSTKDTKTEPDFTSSITGKTEDYIFNNGELKPVGSLDFPVFAGTLPASDYPSDHLSIMTQYRFAKKEEKTD
jgi:hypothetical protein